MANDGEIQVDYGLDASRASAELKRLQDQLQGISANLLQSQKVIESRTEKMIGRLSFAMAQVNAGSANYTRNLQRQEAALSQNLGMAGRGGLRSQTNEAALRSIIADARATSQAITSRLTDELVRSFSQNLRTMDAAVQARIRNSAYSTSKMVQNNSAEMLSARAIIDSRNRENTIFEAANGRAAASMRFTRERFDSNGGADMIGLQGRIMANGLAISAAWSAARGLGRFVVDLDKELKNFQAISTATNGEMATMKTRLLDLSRTVPFTIVELAKASTVMAQAGLSTQETAESLGAVARFATASGSDLATSVDVITSAITAFNLQTSQTGDVANTFTSALNLSKLSSDRLVTAMNYIGPSAASMGMSLEETVSILGALSQSGLRASTMATGARALLVDLQNPSKKFLSVLKEMGLTQADVNVESEGFLNVMERLKTAGFGAAQAYEAFEVRGAAAFVALSNNVELAYEMQRSFTLSNAALDATNIQMTSLSNTASNFYSVVGGTAYVAFSPLLDVLQQTLEKATSALAVLTQYPAILETIAVAMTLIGSAVIVGMLGRLIRGLVQITPLLSTFAAGWRGVGIAAGGASGLLGGLFAVMKVTPFTTVLSIVLAIATAFFSFGSSAETAADRIDALRERVNELGGEADAVEKRLGAIDQALESLVKQKAALDDNPLMRESKILELQRQFAELGGSIQASTASVTDLIRELHNLKNEEQKLRESALGAKLEAEKNLVDERQDQIESYFSGGADRSGLRNTLYALLPPIEKRGLREQTAGMSVAEQTGPIFSAGQSRVDQIFNNTSVSRVLRILAGDRSQLDEKNSMGVSSLLNDVEKELTTLRGQRRKEKNPETIEELDRSITFLDDLHKRFALVDAKVRELASSSQNINLTEMEYRQSSVKATTGFDKLTSGVTDLEVSMESDLRAILRGERGSSDADKAEQLKILVTNAKRRMDELTGMTDQIVAEALAKDPSLKRSDVQGVVRSEVEGRTASLSLTIRSRASGIGESLQKFLDKEFKSQEKAYKKELDRLSNRRSDALTSEELTSISGSIKAVLDARAALIRNYFEDKIANANSDEDKEKLRDDMGTALEEIANTVEDFALATTQKANDILRTALGDQQKSVEDSMAALSKQIAQATDRLRSTRPGAAMNTLIQRINEMIAEFSRLGEDANSLQFRRDALSTSRTPVPGVAADRAAEAMQHYLGKGYTKNAAAGLVGNLLVESNLNPRAAGDMRAGHPTAMGIAQWRNDRWDSNVAFAKDRGQSPYDFTTQMDFIDHEIRTKFPGLLERLMKAGSAGEAAGIIRDDYEKPNANALINRTADRVGFANSLASNDYDAQKTAIETKRKELADAELVATTKAVTASMDAQIKNANKQLGRLSTQTQIASTTESIETITKSVQRWHAEIMASELKKFDQQNVQAAKDDPDGIQEQRQQLIERLRASMAQDIAELQDQYFKNADKEIDKPVASAEAALALSQRPEFEAKYTDLDRMEMQRNIRLEERRALLARIEMTEKAITAAKVAQDLSDDGSSEQESARLREAELKARLVELTKAKNQEDAATAKLGPGVAAAVQAANVAWAQQAGLMDADGKLVSGARQVGDAWLQVLQGLSGGLETFFSQLADGTTSVGDAFRNLGLSITQMFTQIIARALSNQIIMALIGGAGGGGGDGILGQLGLGLFSTPKMALGGQVKGAALGELIPGTGNRDSVLRKLAPGEFVLRQSAVSAIGADKLEALNNLGNSKRSASLPGVLNDSQSGGSGTVNVWIVSPEEKPVPGPSDIVAVISDNIQRRGPIRQLIQSVQMGAI